MSHIFISYSRKDLNFAQQIVDALAGNELNTWIDWKNIPPAEEWLQEIYYGIETAGAFLFLISPDSLTSKVCNQELVHAIENGKRIIPIIIRDPDSKSVPESLSKLNWIFCRDGRDDFEKSIEEICKTIRTDYKWLNYHTRLQVKALEWKRRTVKSDTSLLLRGNVLREAENIFASADKYKDPIPTDEQRLYLSTSRKNEDQQRNKLISGVGVGSLILACCCIAVIAASIVAWQQRTRANLETSAKATALANEEYAQATAQAENQRADQQAHIALSQQLANSSQMVQKADLDLLLLLSAQAYNFADTVEARANLFDNLLIEPYLEGILGGFGYIPPIEDSNFTITLETDERFGNRGWKPVDRGYAEEKFPFISTRTTPESLWGWHSMPQISDDENSVAYYICRVAPSGGTSYCDAYAAIWKSEHNIFHFGKNIDDVCNADFIPNNDLHFIYVDNGMFTLEDETTKSVQEFLSSEIRIASQQYNDVDVLSFDIDASNKMLVAAVTYGRHSAKLNIIVWDLLTGQEIATLYRSDGWLTQEIGGLVRFSENAEKILVCEEKLHESSSNFGIVINPILLKNLACNISGRNLTKVEWDQFVGSDISYEKTCAQFPEGGYPLRSDIP